ncbi:MAG: hypothetical protein WCC77_15525, partial [Pseudolabrys sp.]
SLDHFVCAGGQPRQHIDADPFAVFKLITNSNLLDCSTGKSAGFAPLRIRTTKSLACRYDFSTDKSIS